MQGLQSPETTPNSNSQKLGSSIVLGESGGYQRPEILRLHIEQIFKDKDFAKEIADFAVKFVADNKIQLQNFSDFLSLIRKIFEDSIDWKSPRPNEKILRAAPDLLDFEAQCQKGLHAYNPERKPNPDAVFWPNGERDPGKSIYDVLPVIKNHGWVNASTPIGSAGSCFASEIAFNLQARNFNYVVGEELYRPHDGVFSDDFDREKSVAGASANWGILFNTPSFRQLVEVAFGERKLPPILMKTKAGGGQEFYASPFRENVFFQTREAFEVDQPKHLAAVRDVFTKCKVFVITPGLNECWQFMNDDIFLSRNPRNSGLTGLIKHRTLSLEENVSNLQRFIDIVRAHNAEMKFIISVSPVPFLATGRADEYHVIAANGHSKAMLRVAVDEVARRNKNVVYFPSYEVITQCMREPFQPDGRHVSRDGVKKVMSTFDAMFVVNS